MYGYGLIERKEEVQGRSGSIWQEEREREGRSRVGRAGRLERQFEVRREEEEAEASSRVLRALSDPSTAKTAARTMVREGVDSGRSSLESGVSSGRKFQAEGGGDVLTELRGAAWCVQGEGREGRKRRVGQGSGIGRGGRCGEASWRGR